ncbi:type II CRISPR RNA-guided endonuclease Cas9 [Sedimentisphaera salicampi]|uniref:CRISPR-associated endonuclease Cas9 n=1 Tax=Sedimentisphaera salicampi TaxID=1941349 RepID=A0A1W6LLZ3_9BACT|nr:type II CRISPR RNA-guided endonuclease Cas9 [Sedimentisphaera salicampi]ARN56776.1 CRISPR-associated endonuclease Cas9/Csn1 [Sedimentisphaera salicampi]
MITLGLDIGTNSVGWALIDEKNNEILRTGVRVFPEGVDRDTKGAEKSKNETRRLARGSRRNRARMKYRRDKLVRMLKRNGLLPASDIEFSELLREDPYKLRAKAIQEKISLHQIGRVLFHINQRRGFKSNRKSGDEKQGKVIKNANELQDEIDKSGLKTLGAYFASLDTSKKRIRDNYTLRSMYEHEFEEIWKFQSRFYPEILTDRLKTKVKDETIFYQRPLKPCDDLIKDCELEEDEKVCQRADWFARRFRILQDVNNLKIHNPEGTIKELSQDQRDTITQILLSKEKATFESIRKKLGLIDSQKFNTEEGSSNRKNPHLKGDVFQAKLKNINKKIFAGLDEEAKIDINNILIDQTIDDEEFISEICENYNYSRDEAIKISKIPLPNGYTNHSKKAILKLLPYMEKGFLTSDAVKEVYGRWPSEQKTEILDRLPLPPDFRNPIVNQGINEVRKVVNAVISAYGKPDKIAVEMARDVKGSKAERDEIRKKNWENEQKNEEARKILVEEFGFSRPAREDIIKYKLWIECRKTCPYTGKPVPQHLLFSPQSGVQIEHIIPYSRCLDDSYMNKTLCYADENRRKGEKTPYEYYSSKPEQYEEIRQRIAPLPFPKRSKFNQKEVKLDNFIERQINDTRYISRAVTSYLKQLGCTVIGTKGKITSDLRRAWGLNSILNTIGSTKNRDDHRHHAVDAAVTALTNQQHLRDLAYTKKRTEDLAMTEPWKGFRQELKESINSINVSHRVRRKVSGRLHEDTAYGPTGITNENGDEYYVYRKPLESLTLPMVHKVVDPTVREILLERLRENGIHTEGKTKSIPKKVWEEPVYMKSRKDARVPIKKVRIRTVYNNVAKIKDEEGKPYKAVTLGSNHHIEIFEFTDKKGNTKREGKVVSLFEAARRNKEGRPIVCRDYGDGKKFICSLAKNEMFMMKMDDGSFKLHRVQVVSLIVNQQVIILRPATFAGAGKSSDSPPIVQRKNANTLKGYKVTVDPLGNINPAND